MPPAHCTRKSFLTVAAAGMGLAAAGCGDDDGPTPRDPDADAASDIEIVNLALTLEFLELELYRKAAASGRFKGSELELIETFGEHEQQHVDALTAAIGKLGGRPTRRPAGRFDLGSRTTILKTAQRLENLGAAAYLGQARRIRDKDVLAAAIAIHSVEARHAAALNTLLDKDVTPTGAFARPATMDAVRGVIGLFTR